MARGLRTIKLLTVLDDDASCFARGGNTGDGVSPRGADRGINLFYFAGTLRHFDKLLTGLGQLLAESLVALQLGIQHRRAQASGIDVALPVIPCDDAALAILIAASRQCIGYCSLMSAYFALRMMTKAMPIEISMATTNAMMNPVRSNTPSKNRVMMRKLTSE